MPVDAMEEFDIMKAPQILEHLELDKSACYQRLKHGLKSPEIHDEKAFISPATDETDNLQQQNNNKSPTDDTVGPTTAPETIVSYTSKCKLVNDFEDAAEHLQHNPFIRRGYRAQLSTKLCLESIFWWTNETINIWTHIFGWFLFLALSYSDTSLLQLHASTIDKVIIISLLVCFQACMILSSLYHTFSCRSAQAYDCFLAYDLFGIALSLLAIYISGIYYAFWCNDSLRNFYIITIGIIFGIAMIIQIPALKVNNHLKMIIFVAWAAYGIIPTLHWYLEMGGVESQMVKLFIPRVYGMYAICGLAFLIYIMKIPERWFVGKFDYLGHSHNWWHFLVVCALYYWHNSGMVYVEYRLNSGCPANNKYE